MGRVGNQRGFTLVELMIIVTLLGIFAAIAVPNFSQLIDNNRVQATSNELVGLLQYARAYSVENRTSVLVCQEEDGTMTVKKACVDTNPLRQMRAAPGVQIDTTATSLRFRQNGSAERATAATYITCRGDDAEHGYTVSVVAAGSIRIFARGRDAQNNAMTECSPS